MRTRLPALRAGWTHRGVIHSADETFGRVKFFITANAGTDGDGRRRIMEVFLSCDQSGTCLDGWADAWSTAISMLLQHGETVGTLKRKFGGMEFEPRGMTEGKDTEGRTIIARSVVDYVMRWLEGVDGK